MELGWMTWIPGAHFWFHLCVVPHQTSSGMFGRPPLSLHGSKTPMACVLRRLPPPSLGHAILAPAAVRAWARASSRYAPWEARRASGSRSGPGLIELIKSNREVDVEAALGAPVDVQDRAEIQQTSSGFPPLV